MLSVGFCLQMICMQTFSHCLIFFFSFFLPWMWTRPEWTSSPGQASYLGLAWGKTYDRWLSSHCVKVSHKLLCHTIALALPLPRAKIGEEQHLQSHVLHLRCWSEAKTTLCPFPLAFLFHPISVDAQMHSLSAPSTHTQIVYCVCVYIKTHLLTRNEILRVELYISTPTMISNNIRFNLHPKQLGKTSGSWLHILRY